MIAPAAADVGRENIHENIPMGLKCQLSRRLNVNQVFSSLTLVLLMLILTTGSHKINAEKSYCPI